MKGIKIILCALAVLQLLPCGGCKKKAILYDSSGIEESLEETYSEEGALEAPGEEAFAEEPKLICVYVCGEVKNPGVYELDAQSRIGEAVEAAGGMTDRKSVV